MTTRRGRSPTRRPTTMTKDELMVPDDEKDIANGSLLSTLALFGDSGYALGASFCLLLIAVGVALTIDDAPASQAANDPYTKLPPLSPMSAPIIFDVTSDGDSFVTEQILSDYERDGVVAVRGLLTTDELLLIEDAANKLVHEKESKATSGRKRGGTQFHTTRVSPAFFKSGGDPFRNVALFSNVPKFAGELLGLQQNVSMRMLRDIFLAKDDDPYVCGWHVDDTGFWPATHDAPGVNAWIALDDMPVDTGGGFALAVQSHTAPWRSDAHQAIGSPLTYPSSGWANAEDMFGTRVGDGTCNLETAAPHLHRRMEETKRIYELKRGDILFLDRWLFHRTVAFNGDAIKRDKDDAVPIYKRYSVRYSPGTAQIPKGYGTELSVLWDDANGGRTADEVAEKDGPWYPLCWPYASKSEMEQLDMLIRDKLPVAEERRKARQEEMKPFLAKRGKQQNRRVSKKG